MYKLWPRQFTAFKEAISASLQPRSALVPERKSGAHQLATPVVEAAAAGSMTSSRSDGTYQQSASPVHHGDVTGSIENVASVAVLKEMVQQLCSLKQVVWNLHGCVHGNEDVQDSQPGEGCEFGGVFQDIVIF